MSLSTKLIILLYLVTVPLTVVLYSQQPEDTDQYEINGVLFRLYPHVYKEIPDIPSPHTMPDGTELIIAHKKTGGYSIVPVTVENGEPYCHFCRSWGKGGQLSIDGGDFPTLTTRGLHSELHLKNKNMITGMDLDLLNYIAKPGRFSGSGFIAEDEDIISVMIGDSRTVKAMGLNHPLMAKPLFHSWNLPGKGRYGAYDKITYNGNTLLLEAEGSKGHQKSIFHDEITGRWNLEFSRKMTAEDVSFLKSKYKHLTDEQFTELQDKLSKIQTGEMVFYYIMRYGFYEGHTDYRVDPIAVAWIFGLKTLEEIEAAFPGKLYDKLTTHFTKDNIKLEEG